MINNQNIEKYIRNVLRQSSGILAQLEENARNVGVPIMKKETASFLRVLGDIARPRSILEIGTAIGYSSILMSEFLQEGGFIDTIELNETMVDIARKNIRNASLQSVINVIAGDAKDVLSCLDKKYDMIFLDGAKGQYIEYLPDCMRLLAEDGILVSDNVLFKGMIADDSLVVRRKKTIVKRMRGYLDAICNSEFLDTCILPLGDGVAVSYKKHMPNLKNKTGADIDEQACK